MPERELTSLEEAVFTAAAREHRLVLALETEVAALKVAATCTTNPPAAMPGHGP